MKAARSARFLAGFALLLAVGCAAPEKYVLPIAVPSVPTPAAGPAIVLTEVVDAREFIAPSKSKRHLHQLATEGRGDREVEARSYAQMRRPDGSVVYDFVLPPGETVASVTRQALEAGFANAGYRVVAADSPEAQGAPRVRAEIDRFWSWNGGRDRTWFSFEAEVSLTGVTLATADDTSGDTVEASVSLDTILAARPQGFTNTTTKGIEQFANRLSGALNR